MSNELRCIHRHTPETHPNCFRKGKVIIQEWWKDLRIGYLDIEATDLNADWGFMLSWSIKDHDSNKVYFDAVKRDEILSFSFDKRIVKSLIKKMEEFDIVVTYYGTGYDIPFIRTRSELWGYKFPGYGSIFHWDLYYKVSRRLKLKRNSLDSACRFFGIKGKSHIDPSIWQKARYGDETSLKYVVQHNVADVLILERLHEKLWEHSKWIKTSI